MSEDRTGTFDDLNRCCECKKLFIQSKAYAKSDTLQGLVFYCDDCAALVQEGEKAKNEQTINSLP